MSFHDANFATKYDDMYIVYFSIFYCSISFILFYCSCYDFDNLAALSSPTENDFLISFSLCLGLGLLHLEKRLIILLEVRSIILIKVMNNEN